MKLKSLNKKGVFGLTAVQSFFSIILGVALLAYVIVIIMGALGDSNVLTVASYNAVNESVTSSISTGVSATLAHGGLSRASCGAITAVYNTTGTNPIAVGNFTQTGCTIVNASSMATYGTALKFNYPYTASSSYQQNLDTVLTNTSTGITSFFGAINPIYAILAVLVIILVLVVLVRVVQAPNSGSASQQL